MPTYKCTNCDKYKRSRHDAGCHGSCGGNCREVCETCGQATLISMDVARITDELGIRRNNAVLRMAAKYVSEVEDPNHSRTEASITIDKWNTPGYWGPPTIITYRKGGEITRYRYE